MNCFIMWCKYWVLRVGSKITELGRRLNNETQISDSVLVETNFSGACDWILLERKTFGFLHSAKSSYLNDKLEEVNERKIGDA